MPRTRQGSQLEHGAKVMTIASGAAGPSSVSFRETFEGVPEVFLVHHLGDESATLTASSVAETGFTLQVSGSGLPDGDVSIEWIAHQKT